MVPWKLPAEFVAWVERLSTPLHRRLAWRLLPVLAWVVQHRWWGVIGLPLRSLLSSRRKGVAKLPRWYGVKFRTKLQMAVELVPWPADWLKYRGKRLWLVADGAYAKRELLQAIRAVGMTLVS